MDSHSNLNKSSIVSALLIIALILLVLQFLGLSILRYNGELSLSFFAHASEIESVNADSTLEPVLVTKRPIKVGELLTADMFLVEARMRAQLSDDLVRDFSEIEELYANANLGAGYEFSIDYTSVHRPVRGAVSFVPTGHRAVTARLFQEEHINPGQLTSLLWKKPDGEEIQLASNVEVYSAERLGPKRFAAVLFVTPKVANKVILAERLGALSAVKMQ